MLAFLCEVFTLFHHQLLIVCFCYKSLSCCLFTACDTHQVKHVHKAHKSLKGPSRRCSWRFVFSVTRVTKWLRGGGWWRTFEIPTACGWSSLIIWSVSEFKQNFSVFKPSLLPIDMNTELSRMGNPSLAPSDVHSCQQKSIGLKFSKSQTGSDVRYSCHHNSSRFTFPMFTHSCRSSVLHSLQSITPRIY